MPPLAVHVYSDCLFDYVAIKHLQLKINTTYQKKFHGAKIQYDTISLLPIREKQIAIQLTIIYVSPIFLISWLVYKTSAIVDRNFVEPREVE